MRTLFVTQDFGPDTGGMARRHVEICRRLAGEGDTTTVSTVASAAAREFDRAEGYDIVRVDFPFERANRFLNQMRWARRLVTDRQLSADMIHCGNIRPCGYAVWSATRVTRTPYLLYTNGGDLLREGVKARQPMKRAAARKIFADAAGVIATSAWVRDLSREIMLSVGVEVLPPIRAIDLGTDPVQFAPSRNTGRLRKLWDVGDAPLMITVARLVPHKGQDTALRVLAELVREFPDLRYVMVGDGHHERQLRDLAAELGVERNIVFAGPMNDDQLPEAYATADLYLGLSRVDRDINAEGFGISFLEAAASGIPSVAGDSGGVRSAVRDGETGIVVDPVNVPLIAAAVGSLLRDPSKRRAMGERARASVENHYNWDRAAAETREFVHEILSRRRAS